MAVMTNTSSLTVNVYDAMGMMMGARQNSVWRNISSDMWCSRGRKDMGTDGHQGAVLSMMDGDIPAYGYVEVMADTCEIFGLRGHPKDPGPDCE